MTPSGNSENPSKSQAAKRGITGPAAKKAESERREPGRIGAYRSSTAAMILTAG